MEVLWEVRLFGGPVLTDPSGVVVQRFRSQRIGALLAYLALRLGRAVPREELCEALWPGEDLPVAANRLRVALSSLRKQMEPAGVAFGAALDVSLAGRVRLRRETVWCDVVAFERALRDGDIGRAARLCAEPLLPGLYDEWAIAEQVRLAALCDGLGDAAAASAPEPASAPSPAVRAALPRLPLYLSAFFGRESEMAQLRAACESDRLVTLVGPGGIGKSRLATEWARTSGVGAVFVALAGTTEPSRVAEAILHALDAAPTVGVDALSQLCGRVATQPPRTLILDNAEHVLEAVVDTALAVLEAAPDVRLLVTSRQRLGIAGERVVVLGPLEAPPYVASPERLTEFPALALFLDRARAARPDFALTERNADAVVEICRRLDGLPLAIELAAARISVRSPGQLAQSLAEGVTDLASRLRGVPERHRSLRAVLQSSVERLTDDERQVFESLWVFQGGWDAAAAAEVAGLADAEPALERLAERSLVTVHEDERTGAVRYGLLEVLRRFSRECAASERCEATAAAHGRHYIARAATIREWSLRSVRTLDGERDNVQAALDWGWRRRDTAFWGGMTGWLHYAFVRGEHRRALQWWEAIEGAVATLDDPSRRASLRSSAVRILLDTGRMEEAEALIRVGEEDARACGDDVIACRLQLFVGYIANQRRQYPLSIDLQRAALAQARRLGDPYLLDMALSLTARAINGALYRTMDQEPLRREGEALIREALGRAGDDSRLRSLNQLALSINISLAGEIHEAYAALKRAQRYALEDGAAALLMYTLYYEATSEAATGGPERAALLFGAACELEDRIGYRTDADDGFASSIRERLRLQVGERFEALERRGRQSPVDALVTERIPAERLDALAATVTPY